MLELIFFTSHKLVSYSMRFKKERNRNYQRKIYKKRVEKIFKKFTHIKKFIEIFHKFK